MTKCPLDIRFAAYRAGRAEPSLSMISYSLNPQSAHNQAARKSPNHRLTILRVNTNQTPPPPSLSHHHPIHNHPLNPTLGTSTKYTDTKPMNQSPPRSPAGTIISVIILSITVLLTLTLHIASIVSPPPPPSSQTTTSSTDSQLIQTIEPPLNPMDQLLLASKMALSASSKDPKSASTKDSSLSSTFTLQLKTLAAKLGPVDQLRVAIVLADIQSRDDALTYLNKIKTTDQDPPQLAQDLQLIKTIIESGPDSISEDQRNTLTEHHGWYANLALSLDNRDSPEYQSVLAQSNKFAYIFLGFVSVMFFALFVGTCLFITAAVLMGMKKLKPHLSSTSARSGVYLEIAAVFLVAFFALDFATLGIATLIPASKPLLLSMGPWLQWLLVAVPLWPLVRGESFTQLRQKLGWTTGQGILREIGAGFVGYLAGLPIIALGLLATVALMAIQTFVTDKLKLPPVTPSHPAVEMITQGDIFTIITIYILGVIWAPLVEETIFRGALFGYLQERTHWITAAILSSFLFAIIHPQGLAVVPSIAAIGFLMSGLRKWRNSLIGPMFAHAIHNATLLTLNLLLFGGS